MKLRFVKRLAAVFFVLALVLAFVPPMAHVSHAAGMITLSKTQAPVSVDGSLSESAWSVAVPVAKTIVGAPNNTVTYGAMWDDTYLYVGVKVLDGSLYNDSANPWDDDSVEVYIDGNNSKGTTYDSFDRQIVKGYNDATIWEQHNNTTGLLHGWAPIAGGYTVEIAVPWSNLGVTPSVGMGIGLDVGNNDDDDGAARESQLMWNGTNDNWTDTSAFGTAVLTAPGAIAPSKTLAAVSVDGSLSESVWDVGASVAKTIIGTPNNAVTYGALWDDTYLYVGVKVLDGSLHNDSANAWDDDSVEVYIDGNNNKGSTYDGFDRQIVKGYNDSTIWEQHNNTAGLLHGWAPIAGGYSVEIAIPWSNLGVTPAAGMSIGLDIGNNDDDDGAARESQSMWNGTNDNWTNTSAFGTAVLSAVTVGGGGGGGGTLGRYMGINLDHAGDSGNLKVYANAYKTTRIGGPDSPTDGTYPIDASGDPTKDFGLFMWDAGGYIKDTQGTYTIEFNGSAAVSVTLGDATMTQPVTYNSATNTSTGKFTVNTNSSVQLKFANTKRTSASATNTGITNVKIMRPVSAGSANSYPSSTVFTAPFKNIITNDFKAKAIRYMDFTATNGKTVEVNWADRVRPANVQSLPGGTGYGWQGKGSAWEHVVMLANETNTDMWICIPVSASDDYMTKLAQLIKYGSDGTNPYTSPQANPVYPALNSNLKVYLEYSNELWNFAGAFTQSGWNLDRATAEVNAGGSSLNYDGETNQWTWGWRRQARRTVEISNTFRSVFGDGDMMTRIRPLLLWQQDNGQNTAGVMLNFLDNWYGNRDGNHVPTARPVNYYIWGGSGSAYYGPDNASDTLNLTNIWSSQTFSTANWAAPQQNDATYAAAFGLKRTAYEGGPSMDNLGHSEAIKEQAWNDSRMATTLVDHQKFWERYGGDVLMYFTLGGSSTSGYYQWEYVKDMNNPVATSPKMQGVGTLNAGAKEAVTLGATIGATVDGNAWNATNRGWGAPGTGSLFMNGTDLRWASYTYKSSAAGTYSAKINYTASASTQVVVFVDGVEAGTLNTTGGSATFTSSARTIAPGLHSIRLYVKSGSVTINGVTLS